MEKEYKVLIIDETPYQTLYTKKYENTKQWIKPDEKKIVSFIPGTIVKLMVEKGQYVPEFGDLLIIEAMKMKNEIISSQSGIIKEIYVKEGENVTKNQLLIEFE